MNVEVIPKKVNGEGDQLIDVEDLVAEKEEECLNERFQKHFAIRGFNGKFEKFNKIAQDFSKSRKFLRRFWFKRIMVIFFNVLSKCIPRLFVQLRVKIFQTTDYLLLLNLHFRYWNFIIIILPSRFQFGAIQLSIAKGTLLYQQ